MESTGVKNIAIYGAGGFGKEVACLLKHINEVQGNTWNVLGFFDDGIPVGTNISNYGKVLGGIESVNSWSAPLSLVMAIGSPKTLKFLYDKIVNGLIDFPNIMAPNTLFFDKDSTTMGKGNLITFGCRMSCNTSLGDFNVLNGCVSFGHDAKVGNFNVFLPEARISGETTIGDMNLFGAKSFVAQRLKIGNNTTIGAGGIVLRKTKDNHLYVGNPAKRIEI